MFVAAEEIFRLGVSESAASNDVDPNQNYNRHNENYVGFPPFSSKVPKQTSPASVAVIAELSLVIAPQIAVRVPCWVRRVRP